MIKAKHIDVSFGSNHILKGINIDIASGKTFVVLGRNGTGKSVLLKCLSGLIDNFSGTIEIEGLNPQNDSFYMADDTLVSYVFQRGGLFDSLNVYDNVAFGIRRKEIEESEIQKLVEDALMSVGLSGNGEKFPSELSGGMQKRVGLARAICMKPKVIMYDDPTAGLDPILTDQIADLMIDIKKSYMITSVAVTHDLKLAKKIADEIALIYDGKFVFLGSVSDFFSKNNEYARQFIEGDISGPIDIF